jgi:hypothetical protein
MGFVRRRAAIVIRVNLVLPRMLHAVVLHAAVVHAGMRNGFPSRLHVAEPYPNGLGYDHEYQNGDQQFHAPIVTYQGLLMPD